VDIDMGTRICALELLTTHLISEYLRTVPDPAAQARWVGDRLRSLVDDLPVRSQGLDDEVRVRTTIKRHIARALEDALARAVAIPLMRPSYPASPG
jgi:hypothetical protein